MMRKKRCSHTLQCPLTLWRTIRTPLGC
ncbi:hypothetical protein ID866_12136 [Astraeus odoratus]|nr:hypothetical protein ID866_12136 [Astraeus odoratus]